MLNPACYFSATNGLRIAQNLHEVEENTDYQAMRDEINARQQLPDWRKVKQHAEKLGRETGFSLLAAAYYTVAKARTDGTGGLADGLETTLAASAQPGREDMARRLAILNWMANRVTETVKQCGKSTGQLRGLYRCERACMALSETLDTEATGLGTLQSVVGQKIKHIEKALPAVPASNTNTPTARSRPQAPAFLFLASTLLLVLVVPVGPWPNVPLGYLTEQTTLPKVPSPQQTRHLQQAYSTELQQHKAGTSALYLHHIRQHLDQGKPGGLAQAEKLLQALGQLYPGDPLAMEYQKVLEGAKQAQQDNLAGLFKRFKQSRTAIANLRRAVQNPKPSNRQTLRIKAASRELENYATSLSPLLGRSLYTEQKLQQNQLDEARKSLDKLGQDLRALTAKAGELEQKLHQRLLQAGGKAN
jgi:type VI secretion system protein VasL